MKAHPFFVGTLFIPQLDFRGDSSYRIIKSFVRVVLDMGKYVPVLDNEAADYEETCSCTQKLRLTDSGRI